MSVKGSIQDASLSGAQARSATNNNLSVQEPISNEMGNNIRDSNVVDWESPDDPDNPMNWYANYEPPRTKLPLLLLQQY